MAFRQIGRPSDQLIPGEILAVYLPSSVAKILSCQLTTDDCLLRSELPAPCAALTSITNRFTFSFMTAVTVSSKYQIVIPKEARRKLGISSGTKLQAIAEESGLRLVKEPSIDEISGLLRGMTVQDFDIRNEEDRELL
jgi:AbrB family looped-hinge helix DNA binding protein